MESREAARATSDAAGTATFALVVPPQLAGIPTRWQAAAPGACATSDLVSVRFP